jgi:hypothetical protein
LIYIIYVKARFSTAAKRDGAIANITTYVNNQAIFDDLLVPAQVYPLNQAYKGWGNALTAECRFHQQVNRDTLWNNVDAYLSTSNQAPVESFGEKWDQRIDDPDPDADTTRYNYLSKTWP